MSDREQLWKIYSGQTRKVFMNSHGPCASVIRCAGPTEILLEATAVGKVVLERLTLLRPGQWRSRQGMRILSEWFKMVQNFSSSSWHLVAFLLRPETQRLMAREFRSCSINCRRCAVLELLVYSWSLTDSN